MNYYHLSYIRELRKIARKNKKEENMPHIQVTMVKGRTTEQKRRIAKRLTEALSEETQVDPATFRSRCWKSRLMVLPSRASLFWTGELVNS
jgi:hypothetical protein